VWLWEKSTNSHLGCSAGSHLNLFYLSYLFYLFWLLCRLFSEENVTNHPLGSSGFFFGSGVFGGLGSLSPAANNTGCNSKGAPAGSSRQMASSAWNVSKRFMVVLSVFIGWLGFRSRCLIWLVS